MMSGTISDIRLWKRKTKMRGRRWLLLAGSSDLRRAVATAELCFDGVAEAVGAERVLALQVQTNFVEFGLARIFRYELGGKRARAN
jgi:hypothetical protein